MQENIYNILVLYASNTADIFPFSKFQIMSTLGCLVVLV